MARQDYLWVRVCILMFIPFMIMATVFWGILASNIPPLSAAMSAGDLAQFVREHAVRLRIGYAVAIPNWALLLPWAVGLFWIMRRVEAPGGVMSYLQLMGGGLTVAAPTIASVMWLTAALRPETDPNIIRMLYDAGWMCIDLFFSVTTFQYIAAAIVLLRDPRPVALFPRWLLWLGIWLGLEFIAEIIMPNFRSGPFSWSGLFNYWVPFFGPFTWMALMTFYMYRAVGRIEAEDRTATVVDDA